VPIIYAGFGVFAYFIVNYANDYIDYHSAYIEKVYHAQHGNYKWLTDKYNESQLLSGSESARRNMEINIILSAVWYILNILDATVDAHLFTYNISKDLAIQATPAAMAIDPLHMASPGIKLSLTFK